MIVAVERPFQQLARDVLRNVAGPALGGVEGDHPERVRILPGQEILQDRLSVGFRDVGLNEDAAELAVVVDHEVHDDIVRVLRNKMSPDEESDAAPNHSDRQTNVRQHSC